MKILICMASVDPRRGGPSTAVRSLASNLAEQGHRVTITAHNDELSYSEYEEHDNYQVVKFPLTFRTWQLSLKYYFWIRRNVRNYDAVLVHSLFLSHSYFVAKFARKFHIPYSVRPHGSLNVEDMANNLPQKRLYMAVIERRNLRNAKFLFCTSQREADEARRFGKFRTEVIPLGVDASVIRDRDPGEVDRNLVAFIGRLTRKKGVEKIIESMPHLLKTNPSARVVIAGPDDEGLQTGFQELAAKHGVENSLSFTGHLDSNGRNELLSKAGVFVLPSLDENFGIGVAEAMAAGVPVVITPGVSHAAYVSEYNAGVVSSREPADFALKVSQILDLDEGKFAEMSANAQRLVSDHYSWQRSTERLVDSFLS